MTVVDTRSLGTVLVTGGSGFVGSNFVQTLLEGGNRVKSFDVVPSKLQHPNLEVIEANICDLIAVQSACEGVDTIFHTAAIIDLKGGKAVSKEYRARSYAINVEGTKNLLRAAQAQGASRFVYTASNSVVIGGKPIQNGDETLAYTERFNDLYTETKVVAEQFVLAANGEKGVYTCSIRPSGIWGPGDQTMFMLMFEQVLSGLFKARVGSGRALLDNSYVHNLIHGQILAALNLSEDGTAGGQAYFINDGEPVNMFDFSKPVIEAIGEKMPTVWVPSFLVKLAMTTWQELHFRFKFPEPPVPPLGIERVALHNYFSIEKARKDLGYKPLYTTEQGLEQCLPFYKRLFNEMKLQRSV